MKMRFCIETRTRKYVKGYAFLSFTRNLFDKNGKKLTDTATKISLHSAKPASKNSS